MHATPIVRVSILTLALALTVGTGLVAARPDTGGRDIQDFATADFYQTVAVCLDASAVVRFFDGDNLQTPIGSGKPSSWSDADIHLNLIDTCVEPEQVVVSLECLTAVEDPDMDQLEHASLHVNVPCDLGVSVAIDLEWTGNDDATVRIDHSVSGYFRQERFETASVSGTLVFDPIPGWTEDELAFTGEDVTGAAIGTANEISLPR